MERLGGFAAFKQRCSTVHWGRSFGTAHKPSESVRH